MIASRRPPPVLAVLLALAVPPHLRADEPDPARSRAAVEALGSDGGDRRGHRFGRLAFAAEGVVAPR